MHYTLASRIQVPMQSSTRRCSTRHSKGQGKNPCLPHQPIEKKRRSQRKSASENKKLTVAKLGPQRAEVAANQMREESNIAAEDAPYHLITRHNSARLKVLEVEATPTGRTLNTSPNMEIMERQALGT